MCCQIIDRSYCGILLICQGIYTEGILFFTCQPIILSGCQSFIKHKCSALFCNTCRYGNTDHSTLLHKFLHNRQSLVFENFSEIAGELQVQYVGMWGVKSMWSCSLRLFHFLLLTGSIKVWDFGSGQEIKGRPGRTSDEDLSITGLMYTSIDGDRCILAAGWNNKIRLILVRIYYILHCTCMREITVRHLLDKNIFHSHFFQDNCRSDVISKQPKQDLRDYSFIWFPVHDI